MFEEQLSHVLRVLKNETFQIVSFILVISFLTVYFILFYNPDKKRVKKHEINVYYKGDKVGSKDIDL